MGPLLLSRLLELSEPQEGVLNVAFRLSDEEELPLLDLKDQYGVIKAQIPTALPLLAANILIIYFAAFR